MKKFSVSVVLVRTIYDSNIGASSRAMANMGVEKLILIAPQCEVTYSAQQAAATGQAALQTRKTYQSWDEFFRQEPEGIRISLTARDGKARQTRDLKKTLTWIANEDPRLQSNEESSDIESATPVYLIFGPEDWGLSSDDLELTHFACSIPTYGDNTSLNLAQAVLLALFILRDTWGGTLAILEGQQPERENETRPNVFPEQSLQTWLEEMGFDISDRKVSAYSILKRMLLHNIPSPKELTMLDTVVQQGIRKLREYNQLREQLGLPTVKNSSASEKNRKN